MTEDEMGGACCTCEGEEKSVHGFMWKPEGKESSEAGIVWDDNIKINIKNTMGGFGLD
jgi:hypothetical protein